MHVPTLRRALIAAALVCLPLSLGAQQDRPRPTPQEAQLLLQSNPELVTQLRRRLADVAKTASLTDSELLTVWLCLGDEAGMVQGELAAGLGERGFTVVALDASQECVAAARSRGRLTARSSAPPSTVARGD